MIYKVFSSHPKILLESYRIFYRVILSNYWTLQVIFSSSFFLSVFCVFFLYLLVDTDHQTWKYV